MAKTYRQSESSSSYPQKRGRGRKRSSGKGASKRFRALADLALSEMLDNGYTATKRARG